MNAARLAHLSTFPFAVPLVSTVPGNAQAFSESVLPVRRRRQRSDDMNETVTNSRAAALRSPTAFVVLVKAGQEAETETSSRRKNNGSRENAGAVLLSVSNL